MSVRVGYRPRRITVSRFIYVTDLHGWVAGYNAVLDLAMDLGIRTIVNGGDMLPKGAGRLETQAIFLDVFLPSYLDLCQARDIRYLAMFGNNDLRCHWEAWLQLIHDFPGVNDLFPGWLVLDGDIRIRGCPFVPDVPFGVKDWTLLDTENWNRPGQLRSAKISTPSGFRKVADPHAFFAGRPTLARVLDGLVEDSNCLDLRKAILVTHAPPSGMGLGVVGSSDGDVGSAAVTQWIDDNQPLLTLHGHIHESPDISGTHTTPRGRTICHQPGQRAPMGLTLSIVTIDNSRVGIDRKIIAPGAA